VGLFLFKHLTKRLRSLAGELEDFRKTGFTAPVAEPAGKQVNAGDEIDRLQSVFREMAVMISKQMRELKESDSVRRELLTNVSHDLRTPLTSMQGYLETLAVKKNLTERETQEYLDRAIENSDRLRRLITDLFELSKLDAHDVKAHPEPFSLGELVLDVVQKFRLTASERGVRLLSDPDPNLPFVMADIGLIERALENLIINAILYTPGGGAVTVTVEPHAGRLTVKVSDTGKGIRKEDLPHIFDRYYRVHSTDVEAVDGTGLGLAITKRIAELHGSAVQVDSETDRGSVFAFQLPIA
jgi:signal transduction histidine kinase